MATQLILVIMLALAASAAAPIAGIEIEGAETTNVEEPGHLEWGVCAGTAAVATLQCSLVFPFTCIASTVLTTRACMPLILNEIEAYPWP